MSALRTRKIVLGLTAALSAIAGEAAAADAVRVKLDSVRSLDPALGAPSNDAASFIEADRMEGSADDELHLCGDAQIRRGGTVLSADRITYRHADDTVQANGNARVARQGASFSGPSMLFRITSRSGEMPDAEWEYAPRGLRGCAKNIKFLSGDTTTMEDVTITTCRRDDEAWFIRMNELEIDEYDQSASGTGATLHFQGVPILGSPWFAFPISNQRRSGFLTPTYGMSSTRGVDLSVPYYFNIAPNYDYTLTPRIMTKRGVMMGNQFRFLLPNVEGELNLDYLPNDREYDDDRYGLRFEGEYRRDKLGFKVDYNRVSDDSYISDFSGNIRESSESVLPQEYTLTYDETYWNTFLRVTKNQTLDIEDLDTEPYERVPQFLWRGHTGDFNGFELETVLEATRFQHTRSDYVDGSRFVFHQMVSYPLAGPGWFITPKAHFLATSYDLDSRAYINNTTPGMTVPTLSLDAGLVFERDSTWFGRDAYQTLEPRIFYAWTPYRDQSEIPIFDSTFAHLHFTTLFTENVYSGYDRVSEANQLTAVLSTRYIDRKTGLELFRASVGQRQYFNDQRVTFPEGSPYYWYRDNGRVVGEQEVRSDLLASVGARLTRNVTSSAAAQYSSAQNRFVKINAGLRWMPKPMSLMGLYYRYNYSPDDAYNHIKQVDFAMQWPLTERLYGLFRYNYSLRGSKPLEVIGGLEYHHDCWIFRAVAQRYTTTSNEEETNFFLQLELSGLGSIGNNPLSELQRNIKGYQTRTSAPMTSAPYDYYE